MKRYAKRAAWAAVLIGVMGLLMAPCAMAETYDPNAPWANGQSAAQPTPQDEKLDLTKVMGVLSAYPDEGIAFETPVDTLSLILPRLDAVGGMGETSIARADGEVLWTFKGVDFQRDAWDKDGITGDPSDDCWHDHNTDWETGAHFHLRLPSPLSAPGEYVWTIGRDVIVAPAFGAGNEEMTVRFSVREYGISGMTATIGGVSAPYAPGSPPVFHPGDQFQMDLRIGGDAASAGFFFFGDVESLDVMDIAITPDVGGFDSQTGMWLVDASCSILLTFKDFNPEEIRVYFYPEGEIDDAEAIVGLAYELTVAVE